MKESDVQKAILDYLAARGIFHYRQNSGAFKNPKGGMYWFGTPGAPDVIAVIKGQYVGIEVKKPKGVQSDHQKAFQKALEQAGGRYILAYSLDDVIQCLMNK